MREAPHPRCRRVQLARPYGLGSEKPHHATWAPRLQLEAAVRGHGGCTGPPGRGVLGAPVSPGVAAGHRVLMADPPDAAASRGSSGTHIYGAEDDPSRNGGKRLWLGLVGRSRASRRPAGYVAAYWQRDCPPRSTREVSLLPSSCVDTLVSGVRRVPLIPLSSDG